MRTVSYRLADLQKATIRIGRVGENDYTRVMIDGKIVFDEYPRAVPALTVKPPSGAAYPAVATREGDWVIWDVTDSDLAVQGIGEAQLTFTQDGVVCKSCIAGIRVERSIVARGDAPDPVENWLTAANTALNAIPQTIDDALEEAKESGEFDGEDGISPTVSVEPITDGHEVTITDATGAHTFDVMNGAKGDPGTPGDPTELIDDTSTTATDKVWSAKKSADEVSDLNQAIEPFVGKSQVILTPTIVDNMYYTAVVGEQVVEKANANSQAFTLDLTEYIGRKLIINYQNAIQNSVRKSAMCSSAGIVGSVLSEQTAQNIFDVTAEYPIACISFQDSNFDSSAIQAEPGEIDRIDLEISEINGDVEELASEQAEIKDKLYDITLQNPLPQNGYYSATIGEQISYTSQSRSRAYEYDCSEYIGKTVKVFFTTSGNTSSRATALCNSNGIVAVAYQEKNMTSNGFLFSISENNYIIYVSFDTTVSSNPVVTVMNDIDERIDSLEQSSNPYLGFKYAALGDSITYGFRPRNDTTDPSPIKSYAELVAERLGLGFYNHGISSSTVAYVVDHNPMSRRWDQIPNDADIITVMGGANDFRQGVALGTMDDRTDDTFYGALHVIFYGLYKKFYIDQGSTVGKRKKIIAITPLKLLKNSPDTIGGNGTLRNLEPYVQAFKDVAAYYSCPCLDMYHLSQLDPSICCTVQGTNPDALGIYTIYQPDGTHPTQAAAEMMADLLEGFLKALK